MISPLALSGSISTVQAVLSALAGGADFGYIGSAFIATAEANADKAYKEAVKWYAKAAEQGYANAQYNLGIMYYNCLLYTSPSPRDLSTCGMAASA